MKNIVIIFSLLLVSVKCFSQEQPSFENIFSSELSTDTNLSSILDAYDEDLKNVVPSSYSSKYNFRIRIFSNNTTTDIKTTLDPSGLNYDINLINKSPMVLLSQILSNEIKIEFQQNSTSKTINWIPGSGTARNKLARFKSLVVKNGLLVEIDYDPFLFYCIEPDTKINLTINYEFQANTAFTVWEQKSINVACLIDNEGIITLPPFYEKNSPNVLYENTISNPNNWFNAVNNSYKLKVTNNRSCGGSNCTSYFEAERLITLFYLNKLNGKPGVKNIMVQLNPEDYFFTITVIYKNKKIVLPYSKLSLNDYLSNSLTRRIIGKKCKRIKGEVYLRCNVLSGSTIYPFNIKITKKYYPPFKILTPGDIIYIK